MDQQNKLNSILKSFKINAECISYRTVRNVALYDIVLLPLAKISHIEKYIGEIALALKLKSKPILKTISEKGYLRLEAVVDRPHKVNYFEQLNKISFSKELDIPIYLGASLDDQPVIIDIAQNPHLLVGGTTGSGKSVFIHNLMAGLLRLINTDVSIVDTKRIEFKSYKCFDNVKIANDYSEALAMLEYLNMEMEYRYNMIDNGIDIQFNNIVLIVDELADIMLSDKDKKFTNLLCKIAQKCRASKIYLVVATQRPSVDVLPGIIRANLPARVSFRTASHIDSKIILNEVGAERLCGYGDAIINNYNNSYTRFQVAYTTSDDICDRYSNFSFDLVRKINV